jgi:LysM repeat protein
MKKIFMAFFAFCILSNIYGQNRKKDQEVDIIDHQVQLGESVRLISKKYLVDPSEIYKLNKFAVEGISQGMVLKIPVPKKEVAVKDVLSLENNDSASNQNDGVIEKQTTTEEDKENPILTPNNDITERKTEVNHIVLAKETLYSLARDYNISVDEIKQNNIDELKNGLKIGQIIKIPKDKSGFIQQSTNSTDENPKKLTGKIEKPKPLVSQDIAIDNNSENTIKHKVEPKETLYSLSKKYNVSVDVIKQQNEDLLKNGMQIGQILTIKTNP